jgi:hypothetical protein
MFGGQITRSYENCKVLSEVYDFRIYWTINNTQIGIGLEVILICECILISRHQLLTVTLQPVYQQVLLFLIKLIFQMVPWTVEVQVRMPGR